MAGKHLEGKALLFRPFDRLLARTERGYLAAEFGKAWPLVFERADERMIGRNRAEGRAEDGVVPRRIDGEPVLELAALLVFEDE